MPRKIPTEHAHQPPGERGTLPPPREHTDPIVCPNEDRIAEIERRLGEVENRAPEQLPVPFDAETLERDLIEAVSRNMEDGDSSDRLEFIVKRLNSIEARQTEMLSRLDNLEARPHISEETIRQLDDGLNAKIQHLVESKVAGALGDLRSRVISVERNTTSVTTTADPDSAKLGKLSEIVASLGSYVTEIETSVETRHTDLEQRYRELAEHITDNNLQTMKLSTRLYRALAALENDEADAA